MKYIASIFALALIALAGCVNHPMGLTKEQWAALPPAGVWTFWMPKI